MYSASVNMPREGVGVAVGEDEGGGRLDPLPAVAGRIGAAGF
jgi:hypothetical protein